MTFDLLIDIILYGGAFGIAFLVLAGIYFGDWT
jgi:hypothetical protein